MLTGTSARGDTMGYALEGKNVLVTGASSGIGAALAEGFAERGAIVGICAAPRITPRRSARARPQALPRLEDRGPSTSPTSTASNAFARRVENELGGVDVLVNNAGIPKRRVVTELTPDVVEAVMAINYFSPVRLTLALLPELIDA